METFRHKMERIGNNETSGESDPSAETDPSAEGAYAFDKKNMAHLASCIVRHNDALE